jgi:nicotinamide-nucleotide amidase
MRELMPVAEKIGALLKQRNQTISVVESSAGGLISAALLAVPGASAYYIGGSVMYTRQAWRPYKDYEETLFAGTRSVTEPNALIRARFIRKIMQTDWGVSETGAAGPTGNSYGDPAGHACIAVSGQGERACTVSTGRENRLQNMYAFAGAALELLAESLG